MHKHQTLILCFLYIIEIFVLVAEETDGIDLKQVLECFTLEQLFTLELQAYLMSENLAF